MASIEKRTDNKGKLSYRVKVRLKGHPPASKTFNRLTDAKRWATKTEAAMRERRYFKTAEAEKHTFGEFVDRYIKDVLSNKPKMRLKRTGHLEWWKRELGHYLLADATPARIAEARDKLASEPIASRRKSKPAKSEIPRYRSPATVVRYMASLSHALTLATREWGWLDENPMRKVTRPTEPRGRVRYLSDDERVQLLDACRASSNRYLYPVVVLALSTGMRQGEILGLKWQDVDLAQGRITLHETKNGERRVVPLVALALDTVKDFAKVRRLDTDLVFPVRRRGPVSEIDSYSPNSQTWGPAHIRSAWDAAVTEAKLSDFRFHDLRHSAASYLAMNGASLAEIAEVLGHKTLQMVRRYSHLSEAHTAGVVERMNRAMFGG